MPAGVFAFDSNSLVNWNVPYSTIYPGEFDKIVLDFSLITVNPDNVMAIGLKNLGDSTNFKQIKKLELWLDQGELGFQGMGVDEVLGEFSFSSATQSWYLENINQPINDDLHLFVTVESFSLIDLTATIKMQLPVLQDMNNNGNFDIGDLGIFMDSGNNGPTDDNLTNPSAQVFSTLAYDKTGPTIVLTNLQDGAVINNDNFTLQGLVRDQGNHGVMSFAIDIDGDLLAIDNYNPATYEWSYYWQNIVNGQHIVSVQAYDNWGNMGQTQEYNITVLNQTLSVENSSISADKTSINKDGLDTATITVNLRDTENNPIANRAIAINAPTGIFIFNQNNNSDENGNISFEVSSVNPGLKTLQISSGGLKIGDLELTVLDLDISDIGVAFGSLIKASGDSVYYFGNDAKRYVFPNSRVYFSWYNDFSGVQTITDQELALIPIGGNVTYKPGVKLVKITTDPKVYAVAPNGVLRWIETEEAAVALYGNSWGSLVEDVPDVFFTNYVMGDSIQNNSQYNPQNLIDTITSINVDKGL